MKYWVMGLLFCQLVGAGENTVDCGLNPYAEGGEVPTPFTTLNQRVELAEGETYVLKGDLKVTAGVCTFKPDFEEHPWLASQKRLADPYYEILGDPIQFLRYSGQKVWFLAKARGVVERNSRGYARFAVKLEPVTSPRGSLVVCKDVSHKQK